MIYRPTSAAVTTVITPAETRDLITLQNLRIDLGTAASDDDAYLMRAISRASAAVEAYCDRVFAVETVEDRFYISERRCAPLWLSRRPVLEVTTLTNDGDEVAVDDYKIDLAAGRIWQPSGAWGCEVVVTYTAGYEAIPLEIQGAVGEIVKALQFNRTRDPLLRSENILSGLYAYTLFDQGGSAVGTAQQVASVLDAYRTVSL